MTRKEGINLLERLIKADRLIQSAIEWAHSEHEINELIAHKEQLMNNILAAMNVTDPVEKEKPTEGAKFLTDTSDMDFHLNYDLGLLD